MPYRSLAQERYFNANRSRLERQGVDVGEWNRATKGRKLPRRVKKKVHISVDNHLKGSYGETETAKGTPAIIKINVKRHRGDKSELADTIKHELMHAKHPNMHEKTVYKRMRVPMSPKEQEAMVSKLRHKKLNYKGGAIKRKLKITRHQKVAPGELINRSQPMSSRERIALMGG